MAKYDIYPTPLSKVVPWEKPGKHGATIIDLTPMRVLGQGGNGFHPENGPAQTADTGV